MKLRKLKNAASILSVVLALVVFLASYNQFAMAQSKEFSDFCFAISCVCAGWIIFWGLAQTKGEK